jgi:hypothetical protein
VIPLQGLINSEFKILAAAAINYVALSDTRDGCECTLFLCEINSTKKSYYKTILRVSRHASRVKFGNCSCLVRPQESHYKLRLLNEQRSTMHLN